MLHWIAIILGIVFTLFQLFYGFIVICRSGIAFLAQTQLIKATGKEHTDYTRGNHMGDIEIAYQNKDITSKVLAEHFKGKIFKVYGLELPKIVQVLPTNLPAVKNTSGQVVSLMIKKNYSAEEIITLVPNYSLNEVEALKTEILKDENRN